MGNVSRVSVLCKNYIRYNLWLLRYVSNDELFDLDPSMPTSRPDKKADDTSDYSNIGDSINIYDALKVPDDDSTAVYTSLRCHANAHWWRQHKQKVHEVNNSPAVILFICDMTTYIDCNKWAKSSLFKRLYNQRMMFSRLTSNDV